MTTSHIGGAAVVTGARGGIGTAVVTALVERGAQVVAVDVTPAPPPEHSHRAVTHVVGDITHDAVVEAAFAAAPGPVTSLVTSAFANDHGALQDVPRAGFARTLDVLLTASWQWGAALRDQAGRRPAAIVHIASVHSFAAAPDNGAYAAAKAGLLGLTRAMAVDWGPEQIRCNAVAPGFVAVPRNAPTWQDPDRIARLEARFPLRRSPRPEDIAAATCFLLSPDAAAVTGVCLPVDSGLLAGLR